MPKRIGESILYYLIWDPVTHELLARGTAKECSEQLGINDPCVFNNIEASVRLGRSDKYIIDMVDSKSRLTLPCLMCENFPGIRERCASGLHCGKPCENWKEWGKHYISVIDGKVMRDGKRKNFSPLR